MTDQQLRGRLTLLAISALFIIPIIAAMYLYFADAVWRPAEGTQHGILITPPVTLPETGFNSSEGEFRFRKIWSLVVLADQQCDALCIETLTNIRQIRLSLGPKMPRLQTVFLPASPDAAAAPASDAFPKLYISDPADAAQLQGLIGNWRNGEIFLVDPLGNLMMSYPPGTDMGDVRKDLGHLFNLSGIG